MGKPSRIITLLNKYELNPGNVLLVFFSFWLTAVAVRGTIFWLVYHGKIPAVFVKGYHIHHFLIGFLLLVAALFLLTKDLFRDYIPLALIGSGLALIFDEFLYWTRGHFNYWSLINLGATVIIGTGILVVHLMAKHSDTGHLSKTRIVTTTFFIILFASCLFALFHYDNLLGGVYANSDPALIK